MIAAIIRWSVANRFLVVLAAIALAMAGVFAMRATPVDALPDLSDTQVIIRTSWPGQAPQIVENQVTYPLTTALLGIPGVQTIRSSSALGFSTLYVIFDDGRGEQDARLGRPRLDEVGEAGRHLPRAKEGEGERVGVGASVGLVRGHGCLQHDARDQSISGVSADLSLVWGSRYKSCVWGGDPAWHARGAPEPASVTRHP